MKRAVIYARYSTDLQSDRSIDDQEALCRDYAGKRDLNVVRVYSDRARSGASIMGRDGLIEVMADAKRDLFDVVIVEALDRLSRDQEDLAAIYKRLDFAGIGIEAVHEGRADVIQIGIRGLVGQLYLKDLAEKVHRGLSGVVRDGRYPGGRAYGYRPNPGRPGVPDIDEDQAEVVRRIFDEYVAGKSPRAIAAGLNADGVAPPRGARWNASTINGNKARSYGILQNSIYVGEIVWNRVSMVRDPDTGRRVSRVNPEDQWRRTEAPHLAIVDPDVFRAAQARKATTTKTSAGRRPARDYFLRGIMQCGRCGGRLHIADRHRGRVRVTCGTAREAGTCDARQKVYLDQIQETAIAGLRERLDQPEYVAEYVKTYNKERQRLASEIIRNRAQYEKRIARAEAAIQRLIDMVADGTVGGDKAKARIVDLEAEHAEAAAALARADEPPKVVSLHPGLLDQYRRDVARLGEAIGDAKNDPELATAAARLISEVTVFQTETPLVVRVRGRIEDLIGDGGDAMVAEVRSDQFPPMIDYGRFSYQRRA